MKRKETLRAIQCYGFSKHYFVRNKLSQWAW